tara:strand:+ start:264 stop:1859 length:1596 start_codon:yes stop_codon:yes gene_type:complete
MSNTLRRKMFKLGGSANTHGVGITSNLKMNKGGRVGFQRGDIVSGRGGPYSIRNTPTGGDFLKFALPGDPDFDPTFAPLSEQFSFLQTTPRERLTRDDSLRGQGASMDQFRIPFDETGIAALLKQLQEMPLLPGGSERTPEAMALIQQLAEDGEASTLQEQIDMAGEKRDAIESMRMDDKLVVNEDALLGGITSTLDKDVKGAIPDRLQEAVEAAIPERVLTLTESPDFSIPERTVTTEGDQQEPSVQTGISDEEILKVEETVKREEQEKEYDDNYERYLDLLQRDREGERGKTLANAITQGSLALMEGKGAESVQDALEAFAGEIEKGATRTQDIQDKAKVLAVSDIQKEPERKLAEEDLEFRRDTTKRDIDIRTEALDIQRFSAESQAEYNEGRLTLDKYINTVNNNYRNEQLDIQMEQLGVDREYKQGIIDYYESKGEQEDLSTILDAAGGDPTQILPIANALELKDKGVSTIAPLNQKRTGFNAEGMVENVIYGDIDAITGNLFVIKKDDKVLTFPTYQAAIEAMTQ